MTKDKGRSAQRFDTIGATLVMLSATGFATLPILGKFAYADGLDLPSTLFWRFAGAAAMLWVWMLWQGRWRLPMQQAIASTLLGAIGFAIQSGLFFAALDYAGAGITSLLLYTLEPIVTVLLGIAFLNEALSIQQILGGLLVISSVIVLRAFPQKRRDR
jgi:drug/metabolite transporter (DMT)-like permease